VMENCQMYHSETNSSKLVNMAFYRSSWLKYYRLAFNFVKSYMLSST
jgi:hypothetical protein